MADHMNLEDVVNMYKNLTVDLSFVSLTNLNMLPLLFNENRFYCSHEMFLFDIADLLKEVPDGVEAETEFVDIASSEFEAVVSRLNSCLIDENIAVIQKLARMKLNEDDIAVGIGIHLIQKLSGNAFTSETKRRIQCPCGCNVKLDTGNMYIGTESTWHGELDLLSGDKTKECATVVTSVNLTETLPLDTYTSADECGEDGVQYYRGNGGPVNGDEGNTDRDDRACDSDDETDAEEQSQEDRTTIDLAVRSAGIVQVFSQAIVFGWTEYNRHRDNSPFIPLVYLDNKRFLIVVYNPSTDSLISSRHFIPFIYENAHGKAKYAGIFVLWLILNYRIFFRKQIAIEEIPCGFKSQMQINRYKNLHTYQKSIKEQWHGVRISHEDEYPCLKVAFQRGVKRRRMTE